MCLINILRLWGSNLKMRLFFFFSPSKFKLTDKAVQCAFRSLSLTVAWKGFLSFKIQPLISVTTTEKACFSLHWWSGRGAIRRWVSHLSCTISSHLRQMSFTRCHSHCHGGTWWPQSYFSPSQAGSNGRGCQCSSSSLYCQQGCHSFLLLQLPE